MSEIKYFGPNDTAFEVISSDSWLTYLKPSIHHEIKWCRRTTNISVPSTPYQMSIIFYSMEHFLFVFVFLILFIVLEC